MRDLEIGKEYCLCGGITRRRVRVVKFYTGMRARLRTVFVEFPYHNLKPRWVRPSDLTDIPKGWSL